MSELEQRIRALSLREPAHALDDRILAALRQSEVTQSRDLSSAEKSVARDNVDFSSELHTQRRGTVVTSGWIVASVSMLIGTVAGNFLPSFTSLQAQRVTSLNLDQAAGISRTSQRNSTNGTAEPRVSQRGDSRVSGDARSHSGSMASQIVESNWISPTAAAVAWERQTGQIFNVVNHVSDRRFDMCRECHRVGG